MPVTEEIHIPANLPPLRKTIAWAMLFFALINVCAWWRYDAQKILVSPVRLADHHSENEFRRVAEAVDAASDQRHLVLLGNSIIWGVGLPDDATRLDSIISTQLKDDGTSVINVALPGNSLLDYFAQLDRLYNPRDTFVLFISPVHFESAHADVSFDELVRYPTLVKKLFADKTKRIADCCGINIPSTDSMWHAIADSILWNAVPLYRNRDMITKDVIGFPAHVAVQVILRRSYAVAMRLMGAEDNLLPRHVSGVGFQPEEDFSGGNMLNLLSMLSLPYQDRENVLYVLLDNNRYPDGAFQDNNYQLIRKAIYSTNVLNLHKQFPKDVYLNGDTLHMNADGHALLAEKVLEYLTHTYAP